MKTVYRLKKDIKNPQPDRRVKDNTDSQVKWKADRLWVLIPKEARSVAQLEQIGSRGRLLDHRDDPRFNLVREELEPVKVIEQCTIDMPLTCRRDSFVAIKQQYAYFGGEDMLRHLYYTGRLTKTQLDEVAAEVDEIGDENPDSKFYFDVYQTR